MARPDPGTCSAAAEQDLRRALEAAQSDLDSATPHNRETAKRRYLDALRALAHVVLADDALAQVLAARRAEAGD